MILVHNPQTLIRMIVRTTTQKVGVEHAGILLYDKNKQTYLLTVSRGPRGVKIPSGFARMDIDNPLIRFFREGSNKAVTKDGALARNEIVRILKKGRLPAQTDGLLRGCLKQMEVFNAVICIPSYFRDELLGLLFLGKRPGNKPFLKPERDFFVTLASDVAMAVRNAQLFRQLEDELRGKQRLFIHTTIALVAAIDAKDHYTHGHTARVTNLSQKIANKLNEAQKFHFDAGFLEQLHIASLLHDIGKIGIPEQILNKQGVLNNGEMSHMKRHPLLGAAILEPIKELGDSILGVKYHHEKYDGSGYPDGLKGEQIPIIAAIIAAADTLDAMTTDRPYRKGLTKEEAVREICRQGGKQLNPALAEAVSALFKDNEL
jgi:HD-GYP domain-containing protein (c-di-GMP phosphodiesterase class II)